MQQEEENTMKRLLSRTKIVADELPMCLLFSILLSPVWRTYQESKHTRKSVASASLLWLQRQWHLAPSWRREHADGRNSGERRAKNRVWVYREQGYISVRAETLSLANWNEGRSWEVAGVAVTRRMNAMAAGDL